MGDLIAIGACIGLVVVAMILMLGQTQTVFRYAIDLHLQRPTDAIGQREFCGTE